MPDQAFKSLKLLGAVDVPEETTDPNALKWNGNPLSEPTGGWQWHVVTALDMVGAVRTERLPVRHNNLCSFVFKDKCAAARLFTGTDQPHYLRSSFIRWRVCLS